MFLLDAPFSFSNPTKKILQRRAMSQKINVYGVDGTTVVDSVDMPAVFGVELREDLVNNVYHLMKQNSRQAYAVSPTAGMQHSAESWGTGRAVARVPRVKASGTRRAGQGAFANFCRKGRMAHPTKVIRRWHRKTPKTLRRMVCAMAVAATANPAIVEGHGGRISKVETLPIVISDDADKIEKTKDAYALLKKLHLDEMIEKVKESKSLKAGKGKLRGRRYSMKKGILVISDGAEMRAFENIEGIDLMDVNALDFLQLAPGGKLGRVVVWTRSAFVKLNPIFGGINVESEVKKGFSLPTPMITADSLNDYFYSPEIQSLINLPSQLSKSSCKKSDDDIAKVTKFIEMYNIVQK